MVLCVLAMDKGHKTYRNQTLGNFFYEKLMQHVQHNGVDR